MKNPRERHGSYAVALASMLSMAILIPTGSSAEPSAPAGEVPAAWQPAGLRVERLVSGPSPYPVDCTAGQDGINYRNAEVQPTFAINLARGTLVAAWQQDRWSTGAASGNLTAVSPDLGFSWTPVVIPFTRCAGGSAANGGDWDRATQAWLARARNGDLYQVATGSNRGTAESGLMVTRSTDGGWTWAPITTLRRGDFGPAFLNDKPTVTTDPHDARFAYVVWNRFDRRVATPERPDDYFSPTWFSRTTDGGATWETARPIFDPGLNHQTTFNHIVALPDGTLVLGFSEYDDTLRPISRSRPGVLRSHDRGLTWSAPIYAAPLIDVPELGVVDPDTGHPIRTAPGFFIAAHPRRPTVFITRLNHLAGTDLETPTVTVSADGGLTWSPELRASKTPAGVTSWPSALAVTRTGKVGLLYHDLRSNTPDPANLPADAFLSTCREDCGDPDSWEEKHVAGPFDLATAPDSRGFMLGDHMGLDSVGDLFVPLVTKTNSGNLDNRTDIFLVVDSAL
jgi:hypothetical protein